MLVDPWVDAVGSPFVRLTGSCTVPELSEVGVSGGGAPALLGKPHTNIVRP